MHACRSLQVCWNSPLRTIEKARAEQLVERSIGRSSARSPSPCAVSIFLPPMDASGIRRTVSESSAHRPEFKFESRVFDANVVKPAYTLGEILPGGETSTIEFKSCRTRSSSGDIMNAEGGGAWHAVQVIKSKISRYLSAFLNGSRGGCILFGIEDSGAVSGFAICDAVRVALIKVIDSAVGAIDPQVEVDCVSYEFCPVAAAASSAVVDDESPDVPLCVLIVIVAPAEVHRQRAPVYYLSSSSLEAWIRRAESLARMEPSLISQRESAFADAASGRAVARTWRHLVLRSTPLDEQVGSILDASHSISKHGGGKVPRLWVYRRLVEMILDGGPPSGRMVCL